MKIYGYKKFLSIVLAAIANFGVFAQGSVAATPYLNDVKMLLETPWPHNRTVNIVFHGHSVPCGYFVTPTVHTLESYPHRTLAYVKSRYSRAVVNVITTSIGGENAESGARRFKSEVLCHRPDILFIDYALNDRNIGLDRAIKAWERMVKIARKRSVKVVLMTPTPDLTENILSEDAPLAKHRLRIMKLAAEYGLAVVDSYGAFQKLVVEGADLRDYMAQNNHPNEKGHSVVAELIESLFEN